MTAGWGDARRRAPRSKWVAVVLAAGSAAIAAPLAAEPVPASEQQSVQVQGQVPASQAPSPSPSPSHAPSPPGSAPPPSSAPSVALPPPPDAANPTPEHVAQARRLILATGISRSFTVMVAEFMDQIGNSVTQERPELVQDMHAVLDQLKPEFDRQSDEMVDQSARIYATLLSEQDIDTILAFYDSEAGKRYVALQPLFLNQLLSGTQAWQQKIAVSMMHRVREEMKKRGHDL